MPSILLDDSLLIPWGILGVLAYAAVFFFISKLVLTPLFILQERREVQNRKINSAVNYKIVRKDTPEELEEELRYFISTGWTPLGGVYILQTGGIHIEGRKQTRQMIWAQAIIKNP